MRGVGATAPAPRWLGRRPRPPHALLTHPARPTLIPRARADAVVIGTLSMAVYYLVRAWEGATSAA